MNQDFKRIQKIQKSDSLFQREKRELGGWSLGVGGMKRGARRCAGGTYIIHHTKWYDPFTLVRQLIDPSDYADADTPPRSTGPPVHLHQDHHSAQPLVYQVPWNGHVGVLDCWIAGLLDC